MKQILPFFFAFCCLAGGWWLRGNNAAHEESGVVQDVQSSLGREISTVQQEAAQLIADSLRPTSPAWGQARHFFFSTKDGKLTGWNRSQYIPPVIARADTLQYIATGRGSFLVWSRQAGPADVLHGVVELEERYQLSNAFLTNHLNAEVFGSRDLAIHQPGEPGTPVRWEGTTLFTVIVPPADQLDSPLSFLLLAAGFILAALGAWQGVRWLGKAGWKDVGFLVMLAGLIGLRAGMKAMQFPALYLHSDLFDPRKFASSDLNASMGDLFLNALCVLLLMVYLVVHFRSFRLVEWVMSASERVRWVVATLAMILCLFGVLFAFNFIEVIYHNSSESLDITQSLRFDRVRIVAMASVVTGCISSFLFIHVLFLLVRDLVRGAAAFALALLVSAGVFFVYYSLADRDFFITLCTATLFLALLRILDFRRETFAYSFSLFLYLICALLAFSFQAAWAVRVMGEERQINNQIRFGKDFLAERDILGEYLLNDLSSQVAADPFISARMNGPVYSNSAIIDKVRRVHLNRYFDRYETSVEIYAEAAHKTQLNEFLPEGYTPTGYPGIGYSSTAAVSATKGYYVIIPVGDQRGYILLRLTLKRVIPSNVYPELLIDNRFSQFYRSREFSYAIFDHGTLVNSFGSFNYERDFNFSSFSPELFENGVADGHSYHVALVSGDDVVTVVTASRATLLQALANFSFWFVLGLGILFLVQGTDGLRRVLSGQPVNFTARIQLVIFLAFLLPSLAISATTLGLIGRSSEESIQSEFAERSTNIAQRLAVFLEEENGGAGASPDLDKWIEENAGSAQLDISVYAATGHLMATSQPALLEHQLISPLMDRNAWRRLTDGKEVRAVANEMIGKLQYSCAYAAVQSAETGDLLAIVALPFFESAFFIQRSQVQILSNILIVFVLAFILFSFMAYWASRSLTFPIRFLTKVIGQTTLTGKNVPINWQSSDEIGHMAREYNRMVQNLEESREALARTEKEMAWREMAKQVAHEIKNPLTPMRLTLQQMERSLMSGSLTEERSRKSIEVLLRQVDILNQIADSFSLFAKMPNPQAQLLEVNQLLQGVVNLLSSGTAAFVFEPFGERLEVKADQPSLSRAVANILINGMQAAKEGQDVVHIQVRVRREPGWAMVEIVDDGRGMSPEVQSRLFQPHFTTKESGSGLGLAMARQIIEQSGGTIGFMSTPGEGTTFTIRLPLAS